eukprot:9468242-Pyramimonas_sp.AAC.4
MTQRGCPRRAVADCGASGRVAGRGVGQTAAASREHLLLGCSSVPTRMGAASLKATCTVRGHGRCGCWVALKPPGDTEPDVQRLERELVEWLAHGLTDTEDEHYRKSAALRRAKGMRVKD